MIRHHPADELLLDLAAGALPRAVVLVVGGHLTFCPTCRSHLALLEAVGGELLAGLEPAPLSEHALDACLAGLDDRPAGAGSEQAGRPAQGRGPAFLDRYLAGGLANLPWQSVGGLFDEVKLPLLSPGHRVSMLKVGPGRHVPEHGHDGNEFMLVLQGGYRSGGRHYRLGDFSACDGSEDHTPVADGGDDCICLLVLDGPLAFRDADGQRIAPFLTM